MCEQWLTYDNYYINKSNSIDGLYPECKQCSKNRAVDWYKNNTERYEILRTRYRKTKKYKEYSKKDHEKYKDFHTKWLKDNPDKVKTYNQQHRTHDISKTEEEAMLKVFDYSCAYCGMTLQEHKIKYNEKLHNDHVDDEGYNDLRNDVPACKSCNSSKHISNMEEWYKIQEFFDEIRLQKILWWTTEGYLNYIENKPPYRIIRKQNEDKRTYHYELWIVDEKRNMIECVDKKNKKNDLDINIIKK